MGSRLRSLIVDVRPLRHREVRLLFAGRGVTFFGAMITYVVVPYHVYALTGSTAMVGLLGVVELVALLSLTFLGGALADAADRRRLLLVTEAIQMACTGALVANAAAESPRVGALFVLAGAMAAVDALQRPALEALIPRLVPRDEVTAAGALMSFEMTVAMVLGPAVGGVVLAATSPATAFAVDTATFGVSLACFALLRPVPPPPDAERPSLRRVKEGVAYARSRRDLLGTYGVDFFAMFFGMPMALFPAMAERLGDETALGALYAAPAVGSVVASATSGWTGRVRRHGIAIAVAASVWGVGIIGFGLAPNVGLALAGLALAGGADMLSGIFRMAMWNQTIPDSLRGRMAAIEQISYSAGPTLGNAEAGLAAAVVGVRPSIVAGGVLCIAGVAAVTAALPAFRHYDSRRAAAAVGEPTEPAPAGAGRER
jgi:MFS family permease